MDEIDQIYLERIKHPYKMMFWCGQEDTWKSIEECGRCPNLDEEGHCDDQEGLEEVQL